MPVSRMSGTFAYCVTRWGYNPLEIDPFGKSAVEHNNRHDAIMIVRVNPMHVLERRREDYSRLHAYLEQAAYRPFC
jgi:hypothetical protein